MFFSKTSSAIFSNLTFIEPSLDNRSILPVPIDLFGQEIFLKFIMFSLCFQDISPLNFVSRIDLLFIESVKLMIDFWERKLTSLSLKFLFVIIW